MLCNNRRLLTKYIKQLKADQHFPAMLPYLELHTFKKGEFLFSTQSKPDYLFVFASGKAKITQINSNGSVTLIKFCRVGDLIGDIEFLDLSQEINDVQALEDCRCIGVNTRLYRQILLHDTAFLFFLAKQLGEKLIEDTTNFARNQSFELEHRLAAFILTSESDGVFKEKLTETSSYLGCSYRHLQRVLAQFCQEKLLLRIKEGYQILSYEALKKK